MDMPATVSGQRQGAAWRAIGESEPMRTLAAPPRPPRVGDHTRVSDPSSSSSCSTEPQQQSPPERHERARQLLRGFFASVIRYIERWHLNLATYPKVYVTVGLNQFADWGLLAVAYDSFLYVEAVHEFKAGVEYAPRRNERADPFDVGQMRTYAFAVDAERLVAADFAVALAGDSR